MEIWNPVPAYEGLYSVSNLGRVRSESRQVQHEYSGVISVSERILSQYDNLRGYPTVTLCDREHKKKKFTIHSLVLAAFIGPRPDGQEACHNNGERWDARLANLRWGTKTSNQADKRIHGTSANGAKHGMAKLTEQDIEKIKGDTRPQRTIAKDFGISQTQISRIKSGLRWAHLEDKCR